jgi:calcium permeable stress-gated cation channel
VTAFALYLGLALGLALLFSLVRPRHRLVYAPKTKHADAQHAPPPMGNGIFSWIKPVTTAKEPFLVERIGLDAVIFLRFTRMLRNMFGLFGLIGLAVMIPVNVTETKNFAQNPSWRIGALLYMTPKFAYGSGLWAQVVVAYVGNLIVAYFLWHNYRRIYALRRSYFESPEYQNSLHARTLMVRDLTGKLRHEDGVVAVTDEVNPTGTRPRVIIGRNVKVLPELIEDHEEKVRKLESVLAKYLKNPDRLPAKRPTMKPSSKYTGPTENGKVDSIDYLTESIKDLESEIAEVRQSIDKRDPMSYGFATWDQIAQAHAVAFASRSKHPQGARLDLAPQPSALIWKNLTIGKASRKNKRFWNGVGIAILTLIWLPLNAGIAIFLSNLGNLGSLWPSFQQSLSENPNWWGAVQAVLAPTITSLVYMVLPTIFRRLQIRAGDVTKIEREQHVVRNLYTFFVLNNLVAFSIFSAVWKYVSDVIDADDGTRSTWEAVLAGKFFDTVTGSLCDISPFWITFLLQRNLGAAIDLAQLTRVFVTWFERKFMSPTPRQNIEWTAPVAFEYASYYNYFLFYATIAICFATLQPIILLVTAVYFAFDAVMKKYLLMYVFVTKNESGGQMWRTLFNRLIFAALLGDVVVAVVVVARNQYIMAGSLAPLVLLMLGFKVYCMRTFDKDMKYYTTKGADTESSQASKRQSEKVSAKFGHPALWKPLMTPMVHAKAQHILSEIYKGRVGSDAGAYGNNGFSDHIAMQPIGSKPDAPFEFVSEAQQDFAFYKNREDFREEGGNLYGRPEDSMTERSGTPMGFKRAGTGGFTDYSADNSRTNSPAPIKRKELVQATNVPPSYRGVGMDSQASLGQFDSYESHDVTMAPTPGPGRYTDPDAYDDRANLLSHDISMAQFRSPHGTPGTEGGGYDYFRSRR